MRRAHELQARKVVSKAGACMNVVGRHKIFCGLGTVMDPRTDWRRGADGGVGSGRLGSARL